MRVFDRVAAENLDRREQQLWLLTTACVVVLALGLGGLMYPLVFSHPAGAPQWTLRIVFFGFCGLTILLVGYLFDRQVVVRRLRRQVAAEQERNLQLRRQASSDLLNTLPGLNRFQDRLAMEHRRAAHLQAPLSVALVRVAPATHLSERGEITSALGDAVKAIAGKLRKEDAMYHFQWGYFGILLPGTSTEEAKGIAARLGEGLRDAAGASGRFTSEIKVFNYPDHAASAHELEQSVRSLLPRELDAEPLLAESLQTVSRS